MMLILLTCLVLFAPIAANANQNVQESKDNEDRSKSELYVVRSFDWLGNKFLEAVDSFFLDERTGRSTAVEGRKKKIKKTRLGKYIFPFLLGLLLIKSILIPLILKALAILSGKAILLSLLSLILSAIIGLRQIANGQPLAAQSKVDVVSVPVKYKRKDYANEEEPLDEEPYRYYADKYKRRKR